MLFGCAAKPRGEKLFGFSPSYSHYDDWGEIGRGTHERFIVDIARFLAKTAAKQK